MKKRIDRLKEGEKAAKVSALSTFLLSLLKAIVGVLSKNLLLLADSLHSLADLVTDFVSWIGLRISQRKPTEKFPYGFYKAENLATLFISIFILYTATNFFIEGYSSLFIEPKLLMPLESLGVTAISFFSSFLLSKYLEKKGKKLNLKLLIANSQERKTDVFSSLIVFLALFLTYYHIPYINSIITIFVSFLVMKVGIFNLKDSIYALMDVSPSKEIIKKVGEIIKKTRGIKGYENLRIRKSGPFLFGEVIVKVSKYFDVSKAHMIADRIEESIKKNIKEIDSFTIHVEPYKAPRVKVVFPIEDKKGLESKISKHFGRAPYFLFVRIDKENKKIRNFYIKENPYKERPVRAGKSAANFVLKEKIDGLITKEIGEIAFHILKDKLAEIYKAKGNTVKENIYKFMDDKLIYVAKPTKKEEEE